MNAKLEFKPRILIAGLLLTFWFAGAADQAQADVLQISATGLVLRCPCGPDIADNAEEAQGVLKPLRPNARYFTPVVFPIAGQRVCRFSMVYRDVNANDAITATLRRKPAAVGSNAADPSIVMATVTSAAGIQDKVRKATTTTIVDPKINSTASFYYIEVDVPTVNLELLGFQIDVRPTCP